MLYHVLAFLDQWYARVSTMSTDVLVKKSRSKPSGISIVGGCQRRVNKEREAEGFIVILQFYSEYICFHFTVDVNSLQ